MSNFTFYLFLMFCYAKTTSVHANRPQLELCLFSRSSVTGRNTKGHTSATERSIKEAFMLRLSWEARLVWMPLHGSKQIWCCRQSKTFFQTEIERFRSRSSPKLLVSKIFLWFLSFCTIFWSLLLFIIFLIALEEVMLFFSIILIRNQSYI